MFAREPAVGHDPTYATTFTQRARGATTLTVLQPSAMMLCQAIGKSLGGALMPLVWWRLFGFGILYLLFGSFVFGHALFDQWTYSEVLRHGVSATGRVKSIKYNAGALGNSYYVIDLMWIDKSGLARTYRTTLSIDFIKSIAPSSNATITPGNVIITPNGHVIKADIPIKYLEENAYARPLVIGDEHERDRIVSNDTRWGIGIFVSSLALIALLFVVRRKWSGKDRFAATRSQT